MPQGQRSQNYFILLYYKMIKVFGRITAPKDDCIYIVQKCFSRVLMCYEKADDGCSRDHCHFIGETDQNKNYKALRTKLSSLTKERTNQTLNYSLKEYDPDKDAEAYICKGHKKDAAVPPEILINDYNEDVSANYDRFHATASAIKADRHNKPIWRDLVSYIQKTRPMYISEILKTLRIEPHQFNINSERNDRAKRQILTETSLLLYDMILEQDKAMPNPYLAKQAVLSALSRLSPKEIAPDIRLLIAKSFIPSEILF